jgi:hypothetical protein
MSLITNDFVKTYFPLWDSYFLDDNQDASETVLTNEITQAESEFLSYVNVDSTNITDSLRLDLFNIVRYRGFCRRHGDAVFENSIKPQIVKDYENTIKKLTAIKAGELSPDGATPSGSQVLEIKSKRRIFDKYFH